MFKNIDNKEIGYDPAAIECAYIEAIRNLRERLEKTSDPKKRAKIKSDITFLQEDMVGLDKVMT